MHNHRFYFTTSRYTDVIIFTIFRRSMHKRQDRATGKNIFLDHLICIQSMVFIFHFMEHFNHRIHFALSLYVHLLWELSDKINGQVS